MSRPIPREKRKTRFLPAILSAFGLAFASHATAGDRFFTAALTKTTAITIGHSGPEWIEFFDPDCPFCHVLFDRLAPLAQTGKIRLRLIPVAVIDAQSLPRAVTLLSSPNPTQTLLTGERDFHNGHLAIRPASGKLPAKPVQEIRENTRLLSAIDPDLLLPDLVFTNPAKTTTAQLQGVPSETTLQRALSYSRK